MACDTQSLRQRWARGQKPGASAQECAPLLPSSLSVNTTQHTAWACTRPPDDVGIVLRACPPLCHSTSWPHSQCGCAFDGSPDITIWLAPQVASSWSSGLLAAQLRELLRTLRLPLETALAAWDGITGAHLNEVRLLVLKRGLLSSRLNAKPSPGTPWRPPRLTRTVLYMSALLTPFIRTVTGQTSAEGQCGHSPPAWWRIRSNVCRPTTTS